MDSSGEDTFADASDHFPSPEGGLSSVAHALKYSEAVDSIAEDVQASATDEMDTGEGEGQVDEAHPSLTVGAFGLSRAPLKDSSASPEVGDTLLHLSLESGEEEESPQRHKQEEEAEESFIKGSLEEAMKQSPPLARQTLRRSIESQSEQTSSFWEPRKTTVSLSSPLFRQPSLSSSQEPTTITLKSYRFISEGMRERMLSPLATLQPAPLSNPPSNTSTPRRSSLLAAASGRQPLASLTSSTQYSFSPPVAISPPPTEPLGGKAVTQSEDTTKPFVFSPPFTRSASAERKLMEFSRTTPLASASGKRR